MVNVGIVGTGFMAKTHADAYKKIAGVEIAGFTAVNEEKGRKLAADYGCEYFLSLDQMLAQKDIHVIDICVPTHLHEPFVIRSAEAGKHILCEKPFALTLEAADRMIEAVERAGVHFMIAQVVRFWPEYVKIKQMFDDGSLGNIHVVYANRLAQHPDWGDWFKDVSKGGGGLFDLHLHDIDFMHALFGPVETVYAVGKQFPNGGWNHVVSNLTFKNGSKACVEGSYQMPEGYPFSASLRAVSDEAAVEYVFSAGFNLEDLDSAQSGLMFFKNGQGITPLEVEQTDPYENELRYFIQCVINNKKPDIITPLESREVLQTVLAIKRSLETGEVQTISPRTDNVSSAMN